MIKKLRLPEQIAFARGLSFLIRAKMPLLDSLYLLKDQARSAKQQAWLQEVADQVANGQFLHHSLTRSSRRLASMSIGLIRIGEQSGTLKENLDYLASELKKQQLLRRKIISALIYPAFISVATITLITALTVFIFPKIMPIFQGLRLDLPWSTRLMIAVSSFLRQDGWYLLIALLMAVAIFFALRHYYPPFRRALLWLGLQLPLLGRLTLNYQLANFCRTLGLLLKSGLSLSEATSNTADASTHLLYRDHTLQAGQAVVRGEKISSYLLQAPKYFPSLMVNLVAIGEQTGALADTLLHLSDLYEEELDNLTKNLASTIEPVLMLVMGALVGLVAISIITPIYAITQNINIK